MAKSTSKMPGKPVQALSRSRLPKSAPSLPMKGSLPANKAMRGLSPAKPAASRPK